MANKHNWAVLYGNAQIEGSLITHIPKRKRGIEDVKRSGPDDKPFPPHTILRSNLEFEQGQISFEAFLPDSESTCSLLLPAEGLPSQSSGTANDLSKGSSNDVELSFGLNNLGAPFGFALVRNWNWEPVAGAGQGHQLPLRKWIKVGVRAAGSTIDMFVDDVRVVSTTRSLKRGQVALFMQSNGQIKVRNVIAASEQPTCFVVMQFTEDFNVLYGDVIKLVCQDYGYTVIRVIRVVHRASPCHFPEKLGCRVILRLACDGR